MATLMAMHRLVFCLHTRNLTHCPVCWLVATCAWHGVLLSGLATEYISTDRVKGMGRGFWAGHPSSCMARIKQLCNLEDERVCFGCHGLASP